MLSVQFKHIVLTVYYLDVFIARNIRLKLLRMAIIEIYSVEQMAMEGRITHNLINEIIILCVVSQF